MPELSIEEDYMKVTTEDNNFSVTEIEEEGCGDEPFNLNHGSDDEGVTRSSLYDPGKGDEDVYIAVGKSCSSMDALKWALKQALKKPCSVVYLVHVFPEVRHIPTPLGKFSKEQLSPDQVESYMSQERSKRRQLLQKFLDICTTCQVNVETLLIESDNVAKAIIDLIPILNIRKLVAGTTKSNLRKLRKGGGIAEQILKNAPESCEVKIICEGNELMIDQILSPRGLNIGKIEEAGGQTDEDSVVSPSCACFARKFM